MPFPKSASIAARATEVYTETWGAVLHKCWDMPLSREDDLSDVVQLLPYLRQLLTCCACAGLLEDAMISMTCGHCYCSECQFRTPLLKIQCRQCRERSGLVIETQLRKIVEGYKHLCYILAEELSQNPSILKQPCASSENSSSAGNKANGGTSSEVEKGEGCKTKSVAQKGGELKVSETGTQIEFQKGKGTVSVDADFDPIAEIIKEVQHGTKVPRAVLVIKPPSKYLNIKPVPVTPRKEQQTPSQSHSSQKTTPTLPTTMMVKSKLNISSKFTNIRAESKGGEKERDEELSREEGCVPEVKKPKKRGRKPKHQLEKSSTGLKHRKRIDPEWTRIENIPTSSEEEIDIVGLTKTASAASDVHVTTEDLTRAKYLLEDLQPSDLEVTEMCLDQEYVNVTPGRLTLKDQIPDESDRFDRLRTNLRPCSLDESPSHVDSKTPLPSDGATILPEHIRFKQSGDGNRQRTWDPLCPKIAVKRSRLAIDKMTLLQMKAVRGKLRSRLRHKSSPQTSIPTPPAPKLPSSSSSLPPPVVVPRSNTTTAASLNNPMMDLDDIWLDDFSLECLRTLEEELPELNFPPPASHFPPMALPPPPPHHFPPQYPLPPQLLPHRHHHPHPLSRMAPATLMLAPPPHPFHRPPPPPPMMLPRPPKPPPLPLPKPSPAGASNTLNQTTSDAAIGAKLNLTKSSPGGFSKHLLSPVAGSSGGSGKKRRSPGYSESGWRCRCGTNSVMFPEKVCAKGKCPCYSKGIPCKNCLCRTCHNPFNEGGTSNSNII